MLLPIPTIEHIPPYDRAEALCSKMDSIFLNINKEIVDIKTFFDPFACPANFLNVLARFVNAYCKDTDSEDVKRHRIFDAIADNKLFGTWTRVKAYIDELCGGDAKIVFGMPDDAWFMCGDGSTVDRITLPTWAIFGLDEQSAQEDKYGIALEGTGTMWEKGKFYIDVDNDHLTQSEIDLLFETLFPSTPIGMTIGVGYVVGTDFVPYFVLGEIL